MLDGDGSPIRGARVCAACASCTTTSAASAQCALSADDGAFQLAQLAPAAYVLSAQATGFVTGYAQDGEPLYLSAADARSPVVIQLRRGTENVAGMVIDALGGPIAQARVRLIRFVDGLTPTLEVVSDEAGRFAATVPEGNVMLRAESPGYAPAMRSYVAPTQDVVLALTPESVVRGVALEAGTGKRIPGVSIMAYGAGSMPTHPETISDEEGRFTLTGLEPGRYVIAGEGARHRGTAQRAIEVGLADHSPEVTLELEQATLIEGKVVIAGSDEPCRSGRALLGPRGPLTIELDEATERATQDEVITVSAPIEPDGSVRFKGVPAGRYHVMIQCLHHIYAAGPGLVDTAGSSKLHRWLVAPGAGLRVHVVDAGHTPVPDARLSLELPERHGRRAMMPLRVDEQGIASTPRNMQPGTYRIHPDSSYGAPAVVVEIPRKGGVSELTITLPGSGQLVTSVTNDRAEPVDDVQVIATALAEVSGMAAGQAPHTLSASPLGGGRYRISPLPSGTYRVEVRDANNPPLVLSAALAIRGAERATLHGVVDRSAVIRGRVLDEQGAPVANAWVSASSGEASVGDADQDGQLVGFSRVLSDDEGMFRLERLSKLGAYRVRAEKHHGGAAELASVRVGSEVTIRLPTPGTLQGWVQSQSGAPATSFDISASSQDLPDLVRTQHVVSRDGRFLFDGVPAGKVQIQALGADGTLAEQVVELSPNQTLAGIRLLLSAPPEPTPDAKEPTQVAPTSAGQAPPATTAEPPREAEQGA